MKVLNLLSAGGIGGIEQLCSNIAKYAKYDNTFCFMFEDGQIYKEMKKSGADVISFTECSSKKISKKRWESLCELAEKADIIVTHHCTIALHIYYCALKKRFKNKKFVMTIHSCFDPELNYNYGSWIKNKIAKWNIEEALKISDKIIFVSEAGRRSYLDNFNIDVTKTKVIYNGVEVPTRSIDSVNLENNYTRITYIGRVEKIKGLDLFVCAIKKLLNNDSNIKVWIIGDGSFRNELEMLVQKLDLTGVIEFTGAKRNIGDYLRKTDLFIYPSTCQEVFGISIVEAMSYGVPCVANNVGGIPEIIENDYNGFITSKTNDDELYKCMYKFIKLDPKLITQMRKNCLLTAEKFSINCTIDNLEKTLKGMM